MFGSKKSRNGISKPKPARQYMLRNKLTGDSEIKLVTAHVLVPVQMYIPADAEPSHINLEADKNGDYFAFLSYFTSEDQKSKTHYPSGHVKRRVDLSRSSEYDGMAHEIGAPIKLREAQASTGGELPLPVLVDDKKFDTAHN